MHTAAPSHPKGTIMKTLIIASLLAVSAFSAAADTGNGETYGQTSPALDSTLSRAEVMADAREASARGMIAYGEVSPSFPSASASPVSTAEVAQELRTALHEGTIKHGDIENPSRYHH